MDGLRCSTCKRPIIPGSEAFGLKENGSFNWYHLRCAQKIGLLKKQQRGSERKGAKLYRQIIKASKMLYTEDDINDIETTLSLSPEDRLKRAVSMIIPMSSPLFHEEELLNDEHY